MTVRKFFAIPIALSSIDETWRKLDHLTFQQWLDQEGYHSPELLWYLDYCCRDDYGQGIGQVSAFAGLHYFAARNNAETVLTWPEGLAHLSENLRRHADLQEGWQWPSENSIRLEKPASVNASAVKIKPLSDGRIEVWLRDNAKGETVAVTAQHVISAMPLMVAAHIIESPEQFGLNIPEYAPWLVSNFELHSFPKEKTTANLRGTMWFTAAKDWAMLLRPTSLSGLPVLNVRFLPPTPRSITIRHKPSAASCLKQAMKSCSSLPHKICLPLTAKAFGGTFPMLTLPFAGMA